MTALTAVAAAGALAGCATTQQTAARLQINDARIRASQVPTRVTVQGNTVQVTRVALIASGDRSAFIVQIHNPGARAISDLPISVGVQVKRRPRVYVNTLSTDEYSYFDAHLPVVAAGGTLTWVYTSARRLPAHARPFALVGDVPSPAAPRATGLPVIRARQATEAPGQLAVALHNLSGIPQYQLQVYAFATSADRYVAAGNVTVAQLGGGATATLRLGLLGAPGRAAIQIEALPTIFQ